MEQTTTVIHASTITEYDTMEQTTTVMHTSPIAEAIPMTQISTHALPEMPEVTTMAKTTETEKYTSMEEQTTYLNTTILETDPTTKTLHTSSVGTIEFISTAITDPASTSYFSEYLDR